MNEQIKLPIWFWIIAAIAVLWNAMGVMAFFAEVNQSAETLAAMSEAHRNLYETRPSWVVVVFAIAVFGGVIGSILLLLRNKLATLLFTASLLGVIAQQFYSFVIARVQDVSAGNIMIFPAIVFIIAVLLLWFSRSCAQKGWIS